jgi:hypothetical protein
MVDVILQTPELDVFGGPALVNVSTDFGKAGERGTRTWVNNGLPSLALAGQDVKLYDLYINTNPSPDVYGYLYQYVPSIGSPVWEEVLRLNPQQYSQIAVVPFTSGSGTLNIPLNLITKRTGSALLLSDFIFRYNLENSAGNPVASSFTYSLQPSVNPTTLRVIIKASSIDGSTISPLTSSEKVHYFVSYLSTGG